MKVPVPYVDLASPSEKQVWPKRAACWSPSADATGTPARRPSLAVPYTSAEERISGSTAAGMSMDARILSSHAMVCRFIRSVREALVTSVTWTPPSVPPVRFQMTQESMVPKRMSPRSARSRRPSTLSSSQRTLGPAKYEASGSPVSRRKRSWPTLRPSSLQSASVRVSCQTMALWTGSPVFLSQSSVVSRWLVMPIAFTSAAVIPALTTEPATTSWTFSQISVALCSTQPGFGKICSCSF